MSRVAFVIPGVDRVGGAERQVLDLASGLARRGWRVSVIALTGDGGDAARKLETQGVGFVSLHMRKGVADPRGWIELNRWIRQNQPAVLHAHLPHGTWMARGARLFAPVRVVVDTLHTTAAAPWSRRLAYRVSAGLSDRVTAVSGAVAESCKRQRLARADSVVTIPNGIETERWRPDGAARERVRAELCAAADEFLWCAVGRLEPVKDHALLLRAFARLPRRARLAIAGCGELEASLRALTDDLDIAARVHFLGFQAGVWRLMQAADGFVLTSRWEGLPLSLLEAAACAVPCVATDVGGVREVVAAGETGLLAEPGSVELVAGQMLRLMEMTDGERRALGQRARTRVVDGFGMEAVLDGWERLYGELLAANPKPSRFGSGMSGAAGSMPAAVAR